MCLLKMNKKSLLILCLSVVLSLSQVKTFAAEVIENKWSMKFVKIPAGEFLMGLGDYPSALMDVPEPKKDELKDELPQHAVKITKGFYIGQTEITQKQWLDIMENKPGPEKLWKQDNWQVLPVVSISWFMAQRFIKEINKMDKDFQYRLPSEAEWEYVARAGSKGLRPVPIEDLEDYAWFIFNSGDVTHSVASKKPNAFDVYDMLGNVWEWVGDWYAPQTYSKNKADPMGPDTGTSKVRRGGSYHCPVHLIRPGYRGANDPGTAYEVTGFRVVIERIQGL